MAVDELYLDNLDEYVNDENKVVTYKWLSQALSVHVNVAKQMLYSFVQKQRNAKENDNLHVLYFLSGIDKSSETNMHKVKIVPEENLDSEKATLSLMISCHIYSVQRTKLKDTNALYTVDFDMFREHSLSSSKFAAIKCKCAKLRSGENISASKPAPQPSTAAPTTHKNGTTSKPAPAPAPKKPAGISGMFAQKQKKETKTEEKTNVKKESPPPQTNNKPQDKKKGGALQSMFAKQATKPKPAVKVEEKKTEPETKEKSQSVDKPSRETAKPKTSRKKKAPDSDDDDEIIKKSNKRRRVKTWESSSSEDEMDIDIDGPIPSPPREQSPEPEPEPEPEIHEIQDSDPDIIPDTPKQSGDGSRKRKIKKKIVKKTYLDEGGFMVTKKEMEAYSTDASEADDPPVPPPSKQAKTSDDKEKDKKPKAAPKKPSPSKTKQPSLMNFFKKK